MHKWLLLLCFNISLCYGAINVEKYLKVCNRNSLELNDCMTDAVRTGLPLLTDGIEELGLPALDPYYQKDLKADYNNNQLSVKMLLKDIYVEGLKSATVRGARVRADDDQLHLEIDMSTPKVVIRSNYEGSGQYNALKINARGSVNTTITDLVYTWKLDGVPVKNGTETYVNITSFYMRPDVAKMHISITNDNPDTKELIELGTKFINQNWRILYQEFLPLAVSNWDKIGVRFANKIFMKIPYNQILPNN